MTTLRPTRRRPARLLVAALAVPLLLPLASLAPADAHPHSRPGSPPGAGHAAAPARTATVMTRNLYLGASLDDIITALASGDPSQVVTAASTTWRTVQASHPDARMAAVADEIAAARPSAVGLQEVSTWSTYAFDPQTQQVVSGPTVVYDFLDLLVEALAARGQHYHAVAGATSTNFTSDPIPVVTGPAPYPTQAVRLVDRDVILVRNGVKATNAHHGNFETVLQPPDAPLKIDRGWGSADLRTRLAVFRFVNAHTEAFGPELIRIGEVLELFDAQDAITKQTGALPTVYAGDYNSVAPNAGAYRTLRTRLSELGPDVPTCCQEGTLTDPVPDFDTRIDLLLGTAGIRSVSAYRIGDRPVDLPGDTWWASDHAGIVAHVVIPRTRRGSH